MVGRTAPARRVGLFSFDASASVFTPSAVALRQRDALALGQI